MVLGWMDTLHGSRCSYIASPLQVARVALSDRPQLSTHIVPSRLEPRCHRRRVEKRAGDLPHRRRLRKRHDWRSGQRRVNLLVVPSKASPYAAPLRYTHDSQKGIQIDRLMSRRWSKKIRRLEKFRLSRVGAEREDPEKKLRSELVLGYLSPSFACGV
jgi:hypothetical protein